MVSVDVHQRETMVATGLFIYLMADRIGEGVGAPRNEDLGDSGAVSLDGVPRSQLAHCGPLTKKAAGFGRL